MNNYRRNTMYKPATKKQIKEWQETDFFMSGNFNPLKLFVVIPTIVQIACLVFMFAMFGLNDLLF